MGVIRKTLVAASIAAAGTLTLAGSAAFANPNPNGTGQPATGQNPSISCQNYTTTPGNSASNNGAPFSPTGHAGTVYAGNGSGSAHSNSGHAVSEYDIACYQQTVHNH